jgi:maleate isomerase
MNETLSTVQLILDELLRRTDASRTTLRIDIPEQNSHIDTVLVEAVSPGTSSIRALTSLEMRKLETVKFLEERRSNLIQEDCANSDVPAPKDLMQVYGVKAQMLGPLVWNHKLIGFISVHYLPSTRHWSDRDIDALDDAANRIITLLTQAGWLK